QPGTRRHLRACIVRCAGRAARPAKENGIDDLCQDILKKWNLREVDGHTDEPPVRVGMDEKLAKIMEEQAQCVVTVKTRSKEEENLKSAILAQYAQVSDGEVTDSDQEELETSGGISTKNTNAEEVFKAEREKRERDKEEAQRKREKDKEDRAKQKSKDDERKEKEKKRTQKGERRR
ncbi:hypothetical protein OTU49_008662, partial [Cherax quadricarinatus]